MSAPHAYTICALGMDDEVHLDAERHLFFPVDHSFDSDHWHWWCPWVALAFSAGRLVKVTEEKPDLSFGDEPPPEEYPNLVAYREWLIEHTPTAQFHGKLDGKGREWLKIEFTTHTDYIAHKLRWVGDENADCN